MLHLSFIATTALLAGPLTHAAPANLAPLAKIEAPGEHVQRITDGLTSPDGEWASESRTRTCAAPGPDAPSETVKPS